MQRVSDGKAIAFLKDRDAERMPDWGRIALSDRISVGTGNRFAPSAVELELAEAREVFRMEVGQDLPRGNVIAALNTGPGLCIGRDANGNLRPRVIDRGAWGQSYQRHVANALEVADRHQRKMLSLFDAADRGWLNDRETFRELTLLPLVAVSVSENRKTYGVKRDPAVAKALAAELETACESCIPLWDTYPERLTTANWRFLKSTCGFNTKPRWEKRWYGRTPLRRTAFEVESRQTDEPEKLSPSWNDLPIIAPFDREIVSNVLFMRFFGKVSTAADFDQVFGKLAEYDVVALRERAKLAKEDPVEQTKTYARIAALDPDGWIDLAIQLAGQGRDDEAAVAFQRAVDEGLDRVTVSHEVGWLVDYYLDHGQTERALTVASDAISVYSAGGLAVGAHLMERLDRWDEAEKLYKLEAERYQDPVDLLGFYVRYDLRVGDARYREKAEKARGTLFPLGLTHARISDFERPPFDGVVVEAAAAVFEKYGLKKGHVIVAIDGYRVRDFPQYQSLRGVGGTAMATVIVWTGEEYKEIVAPLHRPHAAARFWTYEPEVLR